MKAEELKQALADFKKKYSGITSADLQTFIYGWGAAQQYAAEENKKTAVDFIKWYLKQDVYTKADNSPKELYKLWLKE